MIYKEISKCRICGNTDIKPVVDLGNMSLTGVFPKSKTEKVESGPLELVKCDDSNDKTKCGLVQLRYNYNPDLLYGQDYGYRSGLNKSMVDHLHNKVKKILSTVTLSNDDLVVDIGSNDSTLLQAYPKTGVTLVGVDPTGKKFKEYYPSHIKLIADFFPSNEFKKEYGNKKAKIFTSVSMFYDLDDPVGFAQSIYDNLDDNGVWVFEQSYMPTMLDMLSYDTICHEHLEYYGLKQIKYILDKVGFKIVDLEFNNINGGSFSVLAAKKKSQHKENIEQVNKVLLEEEKKGLTHTDIFKEFNQRAKAHREELNAFLYNINKEGKKIIGYGASTKGNVVLQYCNITEKQLPCIAEVNEHKFGCYTPGTLIPIISESDAKKMAPDYLMVLPWHFKDNIIEREKAFLKAGHHLFFPLPKLTVI